MMCRSISSPAEAKYRLLYVGADLRLLEFVAQALKADGVFVVRCPGGSVARLFLKSGIRYDVLMFDEALAKTSGREMVRFVRSLGHRERTPVILLSRKEGGGRARQAGERVSLQKPEPFEGVVETVRHLLL